MALLKTELRISDFQHFNRLTGRTKYGQETRRAIKQAETFLQLTEKLADKSRFGPELTEAEIDASADNTTSRKTKEELLILEFLMKHSTWACWISNDYNQLGAMHLIGYLSLHIQRALIDYQTFIAS